MRKRQLPPVSVIVTVKNEERSIADLLESLLSQTVPPAEVVVVDGGSTDGTVHLVESYAGRGVPVRVLCLPGANISKGRNAAIAAAQNEVVASTDAGVRLEPQWLEELARPFASADPPDVVCGFFRADPRSVFEAVLGASTLPHMREIDPSTFLPSSRSVAFRRSAWQRAGGYPEWLDYCEDVILDLRLRELGCKFAFAPHALVHFRPRPNLRAFFVQYYRYARGDGKAGLFAKRHLVRYVAYGVGPLAFLAGIWYKLAWLPLAVAAAAYLCTPYRRLLSSLPGASVSDKAMALALVPVVRLVGDVAKMVGYPVGLRWRWRHRGGHG